MEEAADQPVPITKVYEVTEKEHAELFKVCEKLIADALETIGSADENAVSLINTLPYAYNAPVELPASWAGCAVTDGCGNEFKVQVEDGKVYAQGEIPADSVVVLRRGAPQEQPALETRRETVLENELVRYEFNAAGELVRGFDKEAGREILRDGEKGNVFSLYVDRPNTFEAWDVDIFYDQEERTGAEIKSISDVVSGPVRSSVKLVFAISNSEIRQEVSLRAGSKRLDFATEVKWHEVRRMLRVLFPVDVMTSEAAFDIQYGYVKRPTHGNTSWDSAKFEVVGHRYVDFSERGYGVAILNDSKYGHRTNQGNLDLCLLRSPKYPDWNADQGRQVFTYAILNKSG